MKLQSRSRDEPEINVISLVDVLLVLVLFLMVSTSFLRETEITMQLPEAAADAPRTVLGTNCPSQRLRSMRFSCHTASMLGTVEPLTAGVARSASRQAARRGNFSITPSGFSRSMKV